jgi:hypothetical protein
MPVRKLAMFLSGSGVLLRLFMLAQFVVMSCLMVVVRGSMVVRGGVVVMLAGRMLGRFCHCSNTPPSTADWP